MVANPLPVAWRVRAVDHCGVIQHEQEFHIRPDFDPQTTAHRHAERIHLLFPECRVSVEELTFDDVKK
jgi:hypothetical protein